MHDSIANALLQTSEVFKRIDENALFVSERVLNTFRKHQVSARHFAASNGYGYDDIARDTLDKLFADVLEAEDALVRPQIANGTHAIYLALCGLTDAHDMVLSITGQPYDTLQTAFREGTLAQKDVSFQYIPLLTDGFDREKIIYSLSNKRVKLIYMQRSRGYAWRNAVSVYQMENICTMIKSIRPDVRIMVDNCYGELTEAHEPCHAGVDCVAGSLIKNLGGGLAPSGGYIAGTKDCISRVEDVLTVPSIGREVGSYAQSYRPFYQGLFLSAHTVAQAMKCAVLFAATLEEKGLAVLPKWNAKRADITQSIRFGSKEQLISFCRSIQANSPIDSQVVPEPWSMPGYDDLVIMAAGTFVQGATSELSADAPIREPYTAYLQGALTLEHAILALESVLSCIGT